MLMADWIHVYTYTSIYPYTCNMQYAKALMTATVPLSQLAWKPADVAASALLRNDESMFSGVTRNASSPRMSSPPVGLPGCDVTNDINGGTDTVPGSMVSMGVSVVGEPGGMGKIGIPGKGAPCVPYEIVGLSEGTSDGESDGTSEGASDGTP
jgi:hypothetical protein